MTSEKLPPHDINAEEAVIGSLLIDGTAIYKIATFLRKEDFYSLFDFEEAFDLAFEQVLQSVDL